MSNFEDVVSPRENQTWQINQVTGDSRKFSEYVLVPNHPLGKDKIFLERLGYRPRNLEDAQTLLDLYISQAKAQISSGLHRMGEHDRFGQRFTIDIVVRGRILLTGWILDDSGILKLATPFAGFSDSEKDL